MFLIIIYFEFCIHLCGLPMYDEMEIIIIIIRLDWLL